MIFYRATADDGRVHWLTTQGEAKAIDKSFTEHEIGNQKSDIKTLMNDCELQLFALRKQINGFKHDASIAPVTIDQPTREVAPGATEPPSMTADSITDWLIDTASQREVERVFEAIGCRWGFARKPINA